MHESPRVLLHVVSPTQESWRDVAAAVFRRYGIRVSLVDTTATPESATAALDGAAALVCITPEPLPTLEDGKPSPSDLTSTIVNEARRQGISTLMMCERGVPIPNESVSVGEEDEILYSLRVYPIGDRKWFTETLRLFAAETAAVNWGMVVPLELPPDCLHFTGRREEVDWLEQQLRHAKPWARISLIGAGGSGKTAIVREALDRVTGESDPFTVFPGGVYVHDFYAAPSLQAMMDTILVSAGQCETPEDEREAVVSNLLNHGRCLVYAEGVEKLRDAGNPENLSALFAMCGRSVVLVTSRHSLDAWLTTSRYVGRLPASEAAELMRAHSGLTESAVSDEALIKLGERLAGHPLSLMLAGSLLRQPGESVETLTAALRSDAEGGVPADVQSVESLRRLFIYSAGRLTERARQAWFILSLHGLAAVEPATVAACLDCSEHEALVALNELVDRSIAVETPVFSVTLGRTDAAWCLSHAHFADWACSGMGDAGVVVSEVLGRWKSHWSAWLETCEENQAVPGPAERHNQVFEQLQAIVHSLVKIEGPESRDAMLASGECGHVCMFMGKIEEAQRFYRDAIGMSSRIPGPEHEETISLQENLANALWLSRPAEAEALQRRVIELRKRTAGESDPATFSSQRFLAQILISRKDRSDFRKVIRLLEAATNGFERVSDMYCAEAVLCRYLLADFLFDRGDFDRAGALYQTNLHDDPAGKDECHPDRLPSMINFASILHRAGDIGGAEGLWLRALVICEESGATDSQWALNIRSNLATILADRGDWAEAESYAAAVAKIWMDHTPETDVNRREAEAHLVEIRARRSQ